MATEVLDSNFFAKRDFKEFTFPITFKFKISTLANDFTALDESGATIAYVRQKMFKFKEAILQLTIFAHMKAQNCTKASYIIRNSLVHGMELYGT